MRKIIVNFHQLFSFFVLFYTHTYSHTLSYLRSSINKQTNKQANHNTFYFCRRLSLNYSPQEKTWTYKCVGERCVREHHTPGAKRVPFMSCAMICGTSNIWPMPTGKVSLSSRSLTFKSNQIQLNVKTEFDEAKQLLDSAYNVFLVDLKALENQHLTSNGVVAANGVSGTGAASTSSAAAAAATGNAHTSNPILSHVHIKSDLDKINSQMKGKQQHMENNVNSDVIGQNAAIDNSAKLAAAAAAANANNANQNCDINKITINAEIQKIGDVYLHMEMDESYELNVTSMYCSSFPFPQVMK